MKIGRYSLPALLIPELLFAVACSSVRPPREQLGAAEVAVRQAQTTQATQYAPAELRMAADKLEQAKRLMREEKYQEARHMAEQATVDAQLAESKARTAQAQASAREMRETIASLQREAERSLAK